MSHDLSAVSTSHWVLHAITMKSYRNNQHADKLLEPLDPGDPDWPQMTDKSQTTVVAYRCKPCRQNGVNLILAYSSREGKYTARKHVVQEHPEFEQDALRGMCTNTGFIEPVSKRFVLVMYSLCCF